jgi:hypothetical protein
MDVHILFFVACCVTSDLCDELITRIKEFYQMCVCLCLVLCLLEISKIRRPMSDVGSWPTEKITVT